MLPRKRSYEFSQNNLEFSDPKTLKLKITFLENSLEKSTHILENTKYELNKRINESDSKIIQKDIEIRRVFKKIKQIETDNKAFLQNLSEEKKRSKETQKTQENVIHYFYESCENLKNHFENTISSVTKSLHCIGSTYQQT